MQDLETRTAETPTPTADSSPQQIYFYLLTLPYRDWPLDLVQAAKQDISYENALLQRVRAESDLLSDLRDWNYVTVPVEMRVDVLTQAEALRGPVNELLKLLTAKYQETLTP